MWDGREGTEGVKSKNMMDADSIMSHKLLELLAACYCWRRTHTPAGAQCSCDAVHMVALRLQKRSFHDVL